MSTRNVIFDRLKALADEHGLGAASFRPAVLEALRGEIRSAREQARKRLDRTGHGTGCAQSLSKFQDRLITALYRFASEIIYPASNPSDAERLSVIAVGGYGRGTLAPGSDIDLLFLLPYKQTPWGESVVEYILYMLWDLSFKVGHSTRSVDDCIRLARTDGTIMTALLEARHICGDKALFDDLSTSFRKDIVEREAKAFVAAKLAERDARHHKAGASRYLVEPDVKDGKGGLRDLHTLFWIARFLYDARSAADLVKSGLFTRAEKRRFLKCEDFLWAVRCQLHFMTGRGDDRLSFDKQADLAERFGYTSHGGLKHVERFMKHYFLIAKEVGDLTRIFCAVLEAQQMKRAPRMSKLFRRLTGQSASIKEHPGYRIDSGRLNVIADDIFADDPVNLIRIFHLASKKNLTIHPDALKLIRRSLKLVDDNLRRDPEANRLFLDILTGSRDPEATLRRMNEAGVLGRFIPDFGRIVAMMQFNMYHHYTVDEHLLRTVGVLSEIEKGHLTEDHPLSSGIIGTLSDLKVLYVAALLHDVAKGRKEDHSIAGARIARQIGPRFGLSAAETELCSWLIRHHLLMSETAQMRDLNDFKTILDFAAVVQSPERLKLLLILTVIDIRAVGPGVWNGWKGQLLRTLYFETEPVLSGGHSRVSRADRLAVAQQAFRDAMPAAEATLAERYLQRHYDHYWLNVDTAHQVAHAHLVEAAERDGKAIATAVKSDKFTAITELTVMAPDHPRLLALLTGACAAAQANIAGAQIFTTVDGIALDTLLIQRELPDDADEMKRARRIAELIEEALRGTIRLHELVARKERPKGRIKAFSVEPRVVIDNESSNVNTVIEVNGLDRIGLLHDLTDALFRLNLNIASAHITTFGERAVDVFYVTDLTGGKITNANRRAAITRHLTRALSPDTHTESEQQMRHAG